MIERKIIIGLITSTEYLQQIRNIWDIQLLESATAKRLAGWVWEYFEKYNRAPGKEIESIFYAKIKSSKISKDIAEEIEEDILPSLSEEYTNEAFNLNYLLDSTTKYFTERRLTMHHEQIQALLSGGELEEAERTACEYKPVANASKTDLDLSSEVVLDRIDKAFATTSQGLIEYPGHLGEFWNSQFIRGGFVALMAAEKRGKTFWLMDLSLRACKHKKNVAFFQAGDMTEDQQLKRFCVYLAQKSDKEKYCAEHWASEKDCVHNQRNNCDKKERECNFGIFEEKSEKELRAGVHMSELIDAFKSNKEYSPCYNCAEYKTHHWGVPWVQKIPEVTPLTAKEAKGVISKFFIEHQRHFKLSTHANGTLTIKEIKAILSVWEKQDGFTPDVIVIDYADLLEDNTKEFRHKQNEIWKGLRGISQERHCLVITATQADAQSYEQDTLKLKNFSEDKRKYAHVTAMYGLNQDKHDREKKIGLMRINEIVIREGDFSNSNEVTVLQDLSRGRPFLGSYW